MIAYTYTNETESAATYRCAVCREDIPEHAHYEYWNGWQWKNICSTCGRFIVEQEGHSQNLRKKAI